MKRLITFLILAATHLGGPLGRAQTAAPSLIANGNFESSKDGAKPDEWSLGVDATWEKEGDNHFLRLKSPRPGANVLVYRAIMLKPEVKALELSYKVRYEGIKRGKQTWFDGRIIMNFKDAAKKAVDPSPKPPAFGGTAKEWKERSQQFKVPAGATTLE